MTQPLSHAAPAAPAPPLLLPRLKEAPAFVWSLTSAFTLLLAILIYFHPLWRDEAQAFLVARDLSLPDIFAHMPYEGHPALWHLLLFLITCFTDRPEAMQILHGIMAAASVFLVARYAPFTRLQKILFAFGYFPLFEYGLIARNYQIVLLLCMLFCLVWQKKRTAFWTQGILLALLCHTNIFGIILTAALGLIILLEAAVTREEHRAAAKHVYRFLGAFLLVIGSGALAVWRLIPPPDSGYLPKWKFDLDAPHSTQTLASLWSAYLPIPALKLHFWNTNIIDNLKWEAALGIAIFLAACAALWRRPGILAGFIVGSIGILAFIHIKLFDWVNVRYTGNLYILLITCLWLAWDNLKPPTLIRWTWTTLLALHVAAAAVAVYFVTAHPWSPGKEAAAYLRAQLRPGDIVMTDAESTSLAATLAVYMPGQKFYFVRGDRWGTFALWDNARAQRGSIEIARRMARDKNISIILLRRDPMRDLPWHTQRLASFDNGIIDYEKFYFYRITPP